MHHTGTKPLETERLILRRFELKDAEPMYRNWASDDEVTRFLMWKTHADADESARIVEQWVRNYSDEKYYQWAIVPKELNEPIGSMAAVGMDESVDMVHIGYCIGRKWWHQGYTSEALAAVIEFFFNEIGANRIESRHDPRNPNSGKVMMKCGLIYEGTLRSSDHNNQGLCDACYYGLLKSEWENNPK
jgi:ribosomal-protein-alanine N-acetyltransferase